MVDHFWKKLRHEYESLEYYVFGVVDYEIWYQFDQIQNGGPFLNKIKVWIQNFGILGC
jgi:hypothetical protein